MTKDKKENIIVFSLLITFFFIALYVIFHTQNSFGGGDPFAHYKIARWSWKHPFLLFDSWGKPVYTILVSPFAQLGMNYARLYNVLTGIITAWFSFKLAKQLNLTGSWLVVLLVLFTPIYFSLMFAALTEITFSLFLVLSVLFFFKEKYIASAIALSFLPLVRTEGIVLFPLFIFAFGLKKQWKAMPFFAFGFVVISLLGWPFYHHIGWIISTMPYTGASGIYGHGELLHFINYTKSTTGKGITILAVAGFILLLWNWIRTDRFRPTQRFYMLLLIPGIYLTFLVAHSVAWWKGLGSSLGLIRVMGSVTPLAALTAIIAFDYLAQWLQKYKAVLILASMLFFPWVVYSGATSRLYGFEPNEEQKVMAEACQYIKDNNYNKNTIFYFDPFVVFQLGVDPYDGKFAWSGLTSERPVSDHIPDNSIVVWDAHFGANEGHTKLQDLLDDHGLTVLKVFKPKQAFDALKHHPYEVYVFIKNKSHTN
ncbi:MAG: hypothetical protein JXR65_06045 [Bacteroidales bacterium]|nr:hypothetical protein [Bacteroidales bacterium]